MNCHIISNKQELERAVADIEDWETLCLYLEVPKHMISERNGRLKGKCLEVYLSTGKACWDQVVKVIASYPFYNIRLANKIADTHHIYFFKSEL